MPLPTAVHSTGSISRRLRLLSRPQANRLNASNGLFVAAIVALPFVIAVAAEPESKSDAKVDGRRVAIHRGYVDDELGAPLEARPAYLFLDSRTRYA